VELLRRAGRRVVVVDRDPANRYRGQVRALGVPVIVADATQRQTLVAANVARSAAVAVVTSDDFANIEVALAVRNLAPVRLVLRVFDHQLEDNLEQHFGFPAVRSTADLAARGSWPPPRPAGARTFYVEHQPCWRHVHRVDPGGPGRRGHARAVGLRVVALVRGPARPTPPGHLLRGRDQAYVIGPISSCWACSAARPERPATGRSDDRSAQPGALELPEPVGLGHGQDAVHNRPAPRRSGLADHRAKNAVPATWMTGVPTS